MDDMTAFPEIDIEDLSSSTTTTPMSCPMFCETVPPFIETEPSVR